MRLEQHSNTVPFSHVFIEAPSLGTPYRHEMVEQIAKLYADTVVNLENSADMPAIRKLIADKMEGKHPYSRNTVAIVVCVAGLDDDSLPFVRSLLAQGRSFGITVVLVGSDMDQVPEGFLDNSSVRIKYH